MLNDYRVEKALSGRSCCKSCGLNIPFRTLRLKEEEVGYFGHPKTKFFCHGCAIKIFKEEMLYAKKLHDSLRCDLLERRR